MTTNARDENWSSWINWSGGECPVPEGSEVSVKYRDGDINNGVKAGITGDSSGDHHFRCAESWGHIGAPYDIIAYRYKIKEPESRRMSCIEWAARNITTWHDRSEGVAVFLYDKKVRLKIITGSCHDPQSTALIGKCRLKNGKPPANN